jgi:UDP-N-acetylglucosamine 2-epimerase
MTIVGTRPEIIKLSLVIRELEKYTNHVLVHTGQNYDYELNEIFFKELGIKKPDYFLATPGATVAETIGNIITKVDKVLEKVKPDALLIYGDTNSCLSVISAKRRKIPIFHMEAGNRCFDQRVPEELNRKIVDHLSDINLTITEHARRHLLNEGIKPETIIKVGSSMKEVFEYYTKEIMNSEILGKLDLAVGNYFVVSAHREENIDSRKNFNDFLNTLNAISVKYKKPVIVTTHPRTRKKLESLQSKKMDESIQFLKPLGFFDYIYLQLHASCVISDSGTITEESSILHFPAITIREAHERPEGMDEGVLIMSGLKANRVLESIDIAISQHSCMKNNKIVLDYDADYVSKKVVRIITSYVDYINRTVWFK